MVLVHQIGGNPDAGTDLIDALRGKIRATPRCPPACRCTWPVASRVQVDQQKANGNQGGQIEELSLLFIIVLLVLIFRSLTLALTTLDPAAAVGD